MGSKIMGSKIRSSKNCLHEKFMQEAIIEAKKGAKNSGIPIGSILVFNGKIIARGHNKRIQKKSVILHAEMDCIENAGRLKAEIYKKCTLYTTLSPCDMCAGAVLLYKIPVVVMGENKNFKGPENYLKKRKVKLIQLHNKECEKMLSDYIQKKQVVWNEDIGEQTSFIKE